MGEILMEIVHKAKQPKIKKTPMTKCILTHCIHTDCYEIFLLTEHIIILIGWNYLKLLKNPTVTAYLPSYTSSIIPSETLICHC